MTVATAQYAFDKQSARSLDADGRMRVRGCVISVGEINPYRGREIPGRDRLGLDANTVYDLYRDPDELERAAESFNGLPLMIRHVAQTAAEPRKEYQAGSVFNARYARDTNQLLADLLVTDQKAIEYIESGELADLSSGYRYTPDMTPGEYNGRKYDGVMRAIEGNHVALVEDGRATGAHVADSALSSPTGAPTVENDIPVAPAPSADLAQAIMLMTQKLESIESRLTAVEGGTPQSEAEVGIPASVNTANDESEEDDEDKKQAMDAAVKAAVDASVTAERERAKGVETARRETRADIGDMHAFDSAEDMYVAALKQRGVDVSAIPPGAARAVYMGIKSASRPSAVMAQDSRSADKPVFDTSRIINYGR